MGMLNWLFGTPKRRGTQKSRKDLSVAAEKGADLLTALSDKYRPTFFNALVGDNSGGVTDKVRARGSAEALVFALHLADRIALIRLGNKKRAVFMDSFLPAVQRKVDDKLGRNLPALYNERTLFYQSCRMPSGKKNANLKGTLFWEFGKLMASPCHYPDPVYANWNPTAMMQLSLWGMDLMVAITDAFDAADLF
jgi:hypothetical protein